MPIERQLSAEDKLFKIGEFSCLSRVTVKTLHHYDEIGLLKPSHIDQITSYRFYTLDQLPRIHSIMALKELGMSLEEISRLLRDNPSPEQIRQIYRRKTAEIQQRIREEQAQLAQIEFRLRQIENEGMIKSVDILIKRVEPFFALTMRLITHTRQEREVVGRAIEQAVKQGRIQFEGTPVTIYYEDEFHGDYEDGEICVPVKPDHAPAVELDKIGVLRLREIPAIETAATYLHQGDYDTLSEKYLFLQRWAVENGHKLSGVWHFVWHQGPMHHVDPTKYLTELQHPINSA